MNEHLDYDSLRADTVRQVAKLMAASAITAPKSGGQLFLAGKHLFIETVIVDDRTPSPGSPPGCVLAARNVERRSGSATPKPPRRSTRCSSSASTDWYPPDYDCGACGYATCAEFMHAHQAAARRVRGARVRRPPVQPPRHRPRHRRRLGSQDRRDPLDRRTLPNTHRGRGAQARRDQGRHRSRALALTHPQGNRLRPKDARGGLRRSRPPQHRHPPDRRQGAAREGGARNRQQPRRPFSGQHEE